MQNKSRILIVEKEGIIAKDLEAVLEKLNYNVLDIVYSGQEAIQKAEDYRPDLVISEIELNGPVDGIDVAHQLSSRFNIPVVFLTAVSDNTTIERAKIAEPYGFIIKPFEEDLLHATIEMALYKHGMQTNKLERYMSDPKPVNGLAKVKTSEAGLKADWTRATFIVKKEHLEKVKALAYWDRKKVKEIIEEALESYLKDKKVDLVKEMQEY